MIWGAQSLFVCCVCLHTLLICTVITALKGQTNKAHTTSPSRGKLKPNREGGKTGLICIGCCHSTKTSRSLNRLRPGWFAGDRARFPYVIPPTHTCILNFLLLSWLNECMDATSYITKTNLVNMCRLADSDRYGVNRCTHHAHPSRYQARQLATCGGMCIHPSSLT